MITPEFLEEIIKGTEKAVRKTQATILNKLCKRIIKSFNANQKNILIPSTIKNMHQLMDLGMTLDEIQKIVEKSLPQIKKEVRIAFLQSAKEISNYNTDIAKTIVKKEGFDIEIPEFEEVGLTKDTAHLNMTATEVRKLEQIYTKTEKTVVNMCKTMPSAGLSAYIDVCDNAFMKVQSGISPNIAIIDAIKQLTTDGINVISYDSGRIDKAEVAIARSVRTGINKANSEIVLTRSSEMGISAVRVSQHFGARVTKKMDYTNHAHWQGKVYSVNWNSQKMKSYSGNVGNNENGFEWLKKLKAEVSKRGQNSSLKYPDFELECGYGQMLGIAGINCRHTFAPFYPDVMEEPTLQYDYEENKIRYEQTQTQRRMERKIRETKEILYNLNDLNVEIGADIRERYIQRLRQQEKDLLDFCKENNLKTQNFRTEIVTGR